MSCSSDCPRACRSEPDRRQIGDRPRQTALASWLLMVKTAWPIGSTMRRVQFLNLGSSEFDYRPGQALSFQMPLDDGTCGRRDFTIRSYDRSSGELTVDFFLHPDTPSSRWVRSATRGAVIEARGPRGRTTINSDADWHIFSGDETCIPAIFHMLETLPSAARAIAFLEVAGPQDEIAFESAARVTLTWLHRGRRSSGPSRALVDCIRDCEFPGGAGQAYVIGETNTVRQQRRILISRGMRPNQISAEGYWRIGREGGNDHIND